MSTNPRDGNSGTSAPPFRIAPQLHQILYKRPGREHLEPKPEEVLPEWEKMRDLLGGPEQVERLRVTLIDWMSTGLLGPYDDRFYDKRSRIGRRHVSIGLPHQYMFTAMSVVRTAYHDRIAQLCTYDRAHVCDGGAQRGQHLRLE